MTDGFVPDARCRPRSLQRVCAPFTRAVACAILFLPTLCGAHALPLLENLVPLCVHGESLPAPVRSSEEEHEESKLTNCSSSHRRARKEHRRTVPRVAHTWERTLPQSRALPTFPLTAPCPGCEHANRNGTGVPLLL